MHKLGSGEHVMRMCVNYTCIFNKLQATGLFLALEGSSTLTDPFASGRKYHKFVNNAVFNLFVVWVTAASALQLEHTPQLLRSVCPAGYEIWENITLLGI